MTDQLRAALEDIARSAEPASDAADGALRLATRRRARHRALAPVAAVAAVACVALAVSLAIQPGAAQRPTGPADVSDSPSVGPTPTSPPTPAPSPSGPGSVPSRVGKLASSVPSVVTHPIARAALMYVSRDNSVLLLSADGDEVRRLEIPGSGKGVFQNAVALSPDGTKLAYSVGPTDFSHPQTNPATELRILTLATGATTRIPLVGNGLGEEVRAIEWSADGTRLLVQAGEIEQTYADGQTSGASMSAAAKPSDDPSKLAVASAEASAAAAHEGKPDGGPSQALGSGWTARIVAFTYDVRTGAMAESLPVTTLDWCWSADGTRVLEPTVDGFQVVDMAGNVVSTFKVKQDRSEGAEGPGSTPLWTWSPDGDTAATVNRIATAGHPLNYSDGSDQPFVLRLFSLRHKDSSGNAAEIDVQLGVVNSAYLVGWVDDTHVLVAAFLHDGSQSIASVDTSSGVQSPAVTVASSAEASYVQVAGDIVRSGGFRS